MVTEDLIKSYSHPRHSNSMKPHWREAYKHHIVCWAKHFPPMPYSLNNTLTVPWYSRLWNNLAQCNTTSNVKFFCILKRLLLWDILKNLIALIRLSKICEDKYKCVNLLNIYRFFKCVYQSLCGHVYMSAAAMEAIDGSWSPGADTIVSCEPLDLGVRNWTLGHYKSSKGSWPLSYLIKTRFTLL